MIYQNNLYFYPRFPIDDSRPPTLYSIMNSLANFNKEDKTQIINLAKETHDKIFNFDYPLSNKINKEKFECMILNKNIMRRIGFDTVTSFQIQLNVKLNEIMPMYNKMFESLEGWNLFEDGETTSEEGRDERNTNSKSESTQQNTSNTITSNVSKRRNSELPQSEIENVENSSYLTNYNFDTDENTGNDTSISKGNAENITEDTNKYEKITKRSPYNKIEIYKEFQENIKSIYTLILKDLDCLFYGLV